MKTQIRKQDDRITDSNKRLTRLEDRVREMKVDLDENKSIYIRAGAIKKLAIPKTPVEAKTDSENGDSEAIKTKLITK